MTTADWLTSCSVSTEILLYSLIVRSI